MKTVIRHGIKFDKYLTKQTARSLISYTSWRHQR